MNVFPKKIMKLDEKNNFNNLNNLYSSLRLSSSHRAYTKLNANNINKKLFDEKNKTISSQRNNYKIKKFNSNLILDNSTTKNLTNKKNLFKESYIRTKSNDNKKSKILETQKKSIIRSRIFENMNIKNLITETIDNKLKRNKKNKLDDNKNKLNTLIKVNIKKRENNNSITANKTIGKNKNIKPYTKSKNKKIRFNYKTEENVFFNHHKSIYNLISQENFYNNEMNKIIFIQNFWRKYLYLRKNIYNKSERISIINQAFIKLRKCIYSYFFKLLKKEIFGIRYYLYFWLNKMYLNKIMQKIIYFRRKYKFKKFQNIVQMKRPNLSSRHSRSNFNRFTSLNINKLNLANFSLIKNNLSYTDNISSNKKINNFNQNAIFSSFYDINSIRKAYNKSTEKSNIKTNKNKIFNKNNKTKLKDLFKTNEINFNSINAITPSNKVNKYTNKFYNKIINFNTINNNNEHHKLNKNNNNKTLRTILNRNILLNKKHLSYNYIYDEIKHISPITTNNRRNKKPHIILANINTNNNINVIKDNRTVKNRFYKLKKFDTCQQSIINKKSNKLFYIKSIINKCFHHWKNITFKTKFIKYLITEKNKIKIRQLFFRRTIRMILDIFQIIILKIYFDKYNNRAIQTSLLLKLRAFILKNNKLKKYLDLSNKENINYIEIKGIDVINNININNFVNYNNTNKIMPLEKNNNILNNYTLVNNFRIPLSYINNKSINIINNKNNKNVKIKNSFPKGIFIAQINQLRMIFNLIGKHSQNNINIKNYFEIWKENLKKNYKKIDILNKRGKSELNRYIKINKNTVYSPREDSRYNKEKNDNFQNNISNRLIENMNKKK